ncbi:hypothetical protein ACKKBF_B15125 [Auxenochlorella protothecoides x Auxenochlorella symbiontica]
MARGTALLGASAALAAGYLLARRLHPNYSLNKLLNGNLRLFGGSDRLLLRTLASSSDRRYLLQHWPRPGTKDAAKRDLVAAAAGAQGDAPGSLEPLRQAVLTAPVAERRPHRLVAHGDVRVDDYYWLRDDDRSDPRVLAHLQAETEYTKAMLADTEALQEALTAEMRGRIQEADEGVPTRYGQYQYYSRTLEGQQYSVHCRRRLGPGAGARPSETDALDPSQPEEVLLDENAEARAHAFYMVGGFEVSPNHELLAYAVDTVGGEKFTLHVKDLKTGRELLTEPVQDTAGNFVWANDNATLFYVTKDALDRPYKVWRHRVGTPAALDACVFHEADEAFYVGVGRTRDDRHLLISAGSAVTSDVRMLPADDPTADWRAVLPRAHETEYSVTTRGGALFVTLRDAARPNSEVLVAPLADPAALAVLVPHRDDVKLEGISLSAGHLVSFERREGLQQAVVYRLPEGLAPPTAETLGAGEPVTLDEPAYELGPGSQGDFDSPLLRLVYSSLKTPATTMDVNLKTGARAIKKVQPVLGGFDPARYTTERLWAAAPDGVRVPISLVYRADLARRDGSDPFLLDGYGAYEVCNDPDFRSTRLSLLDRGVGFAIAHVRGGGEMGRRWYEAGKYLAKRNTFGDFIACAEHLVSAGYTRADRLCIEGRSAGGLTMGAVLNARPDLFHAAILGVPFVDCLTTMLDASIPLTVIEREEWGDPREPAYYDYMKSYSPADNVAAADYPHILVTAGLHDPRVGYWEPAKFVAALRAARTNPRKLLLFKCDMGAGHFSQSGRFDRLRERAVEIAFLLKACGLLDARI